MSLEASVTVPVRRLPSLLTLATCVIGLAVAVPILGILVHLLRPSGTEWQETAAIVLPGFLLNTAILLLAVAVGTIVIGTATAWLVVMCRFPGRRMFEWALALPLAVPAYVMAYTWTDLLQFAGPAQTFLREIFGWGARDYWFPEIRSVGGAATMFVFVLYPYVYLLARTAFIEQSVCALDAGRILGNGPWRNFARVALPLARPAIAAGVALALMETLADFGTVAYFEVGTFTTGIYRAWFSFNDKVAAAQLASLLLLFAVALLTIERRSRADRRFHHTTPRYRPLPAHRLTGWRAGAATAACAIPLSIGFVVPALVLLRFALFSGDAQWGARYFRLAFNSVVVAALAALFTVLIALALSYAARVMRRGPAVWVARFAGLGYAVPGIVIAVGVLSPVAAFDNALDAWLRATFGISSGLLITGTVAGVVYALVVRFLAAALQPIEAGLAKVTPNLDGAARTLGAAPGEALRRVHAPMLKGALATAGLIVFVDAMKELPATLMLRPFNFDTLAVQAYNLTRDERLAEASTAALTIVAVGLLPLIVLTRTIVGARPGSAEPPL